MRASAAASPARATARAASRVNRGSVRTETASPPTSANETRACMRSPAILRSAASSAVTRLCRSGARPARDNRQTLRQAAHEATDRVGGRSLPRQRSDDGAAGSGASDPHPPRIDRASCETRPATTSGHCSAPPRDHPGIRDLVAGGAVSHFSLSCFRAPARMFRSE